MTNNQLHTDVAIVGGGIAGLMLQARLAKLGLSTLLLEQHTLGGEQTTKAQGIIHGGIKYALLGQITKAASSIADQPKLWSSYLTNTLLANDQQNHLNLSKTKILSTHHDLWNNGDLKNKLKQIVMQKAFSSHGEVLTHHDKNFPAVLNNKQFKGTVYKINETVIDVFSLLANLAELNADKIIKIDISSLQLNFDSINTANKINSLSFTDQGKTLTVHAQQYIFTAGQNNQSILDLFPKNNLLPKMQLRPLHMVMAKFPNAGNRLYGHYTGDGILPELTITTHHTHDNQYVWYMGGKIAETGVNRNQAEQISQTKALIKNIFPWLDTTSWQWQSFIVNRAEPLQADGSRPDHAYFQNINNAIISWPVKMALAPMLCNKLIDYLKSLNIQSKYSQLNITDYNLTTPQIAQPIWDELFTN